MSSILAAMAMASRVPARTSRASSSSFSSTVRTSTETLDAPPGEAAHVMDYVSLFQDRAEELLDRLLERDQVFEGRRLLEGPRRRLHGLETGVPRRRRPAHRLGGLERLQERAVANAGAPLGLPFRRGDRRLPPLGMAHLHGPSPPWPGRISRRSSSLTIAWCTSSAGAEASTSTTRSRAPPLDFQVALPDPLVVGAIPRLQPVGGAAAPPGRFLGIQVQQERDRRLKAPGRDGVEGADHLQGHLAAVSLIGLGGVGVSAPRPPPRRAGARAGSTRST